MRSQHDLSRRELLALGGGTLLVACTGNLDVFVPATPRYAARSFPIGTLGVVLDPANPLANFTQEGGQGFAAAPGVLSLTDISTSDVITFFAGDPNAAPGVELDVVASFQVRSFSLANADSGVRLNINDGVENAVYLCCVVIDGERCLALAADTNFTDASNYPAFVVADWTAPISVRFRRTALGDAEIVEVNGAAPPTPTRLLEAQLPVRNRAVASVEFGCSGVEAQAQADFTQFYSEARASQILGEIALAELRIRDRDSGDRLRFRAAFTLGAGADGIDPGSGSVTVRLSTLAGGQIYPPAASDFNPLTGFIARGRAPRRRWSLEDSEEARTGIEQLDIDEGPNDGGELALRDVGADLPDADYSTVDVTVEVGRNLLTGTASLVELPTGSGRWRLRRQSPFDRHQLGAKRQWAVRGQPAR